jgi:tRNA splicing ligase
MNLIVPIAVLGCTLTTVTGLMVLMEVLRRR